MDKLLNKARGLYIDRQRIALAALIAMYAASFILFYSNGIDSILKDPPIDWIPAGWAQGFEVVASFNTVGFFLAFSVMMFFYAFWHWAFMPSPAVTYTISILKGVFGQKSKITQSLGKRFRVYVSDTEFIDVKCRIREQESGEWFVYKLTSPIISSEKREDIALRHGMAVRNNRFTTWVAHDELHHRSILLAKAISLAS